MDLELARLRSRRARLAIEIIFELIHVGGEVWVQLLVAKFEYTLVRCSFGRDCANPKKPA
jgi:hypothetical protein